MQKPATQQKIQETTTDKAREAGKQGHRQLAGTQRERHG